MEALSSPAFIVTAIFALLGLVHVYWALGGRLGASKMAVDREWVPQERQIGMTGTTVAPRLYVAVAI